MSHCHLQWSFCYSLQRLHRVHSRFRVGVPRFPSANPTNPSYFFLDPPVLFEPLAPTSTGEVRFLTATGIKWGELEPLADRCSRVLVW